jgi:metal-responsive CopG/Arc/MetJ family transcriptional regulator
MKTAISLPDEIYEAAEQVARVLGLSRSELYATAVREFVERRRREDVTAKLNEVYADDGASSALDPRLGTLQALSMDGKDWS